MVDNTASDVRSVISNATRLKPDNNRNPVMRGLKGKNDTIATKEEIQASKGLESSPLTANSAVANFRKNTGVAQTTPNFKASDYQTSTQKTAQDKMMSTPEDKVSSDTVVNRGAMRTGIESTGYSDPNQINDSGTQIAGVEIQGPQGNVINAEQESNKPTVGQRFGPTGIGRYQQKQEAALDERKINMGNTLTNLYATVNDRLNNRGLYTSLEDVRQYIPELNEYNDATVNQIISDMTYLSQQGGNETQNLLSLFEAYGLDAELQFEQLDDVTKGEYLAYLAKAGQEEQAPGWMDYIANIFANGQLEIGDNMTLNEFLTSTSEEAEKGKVKTRQLKGAQVADYRNLLNKYAEYYTVTDKKALNDRFSTYLKWQNKELSAKEAAEKGANIWYEYGGIQDMIQWKDKEKEKEFKKEYNKMLWGEEKELIKNTSRNALIGTVNLASGMYSFFNNLLTVDTTNGVKIASPSAKGVIQLGLGTAINTYENITGREEAGDKIKERGNSMEANGGWAGKFLNGIIQGSEENASFLWNDYIVPNYGSIEKFMDSLTDDPVNTISDIVTLWELSTRLAGKIGIGGKTYKLDPKTGTVMYDRKGNPIQISKLSLVADDIAKLDPATWMGAAYGKIGETALKVTTAPVKGTFKILGKGASRLIDNIASKATGLSKEQRDFIRDNPELVQDFLRGNRTADDLIKEIEDKYGSEKAAKIAEGRIFELLKKDQTPLDTRGMLYKIQDAFGELGVVIDEAGKIQFTKPIEDSVKARITKAYEYINSIAYGSAKAGDVHWAREGIGGLTKWDQGHTMTAQESMMNNAMKTVYNGIGEVLKTQVKGWAEADAEYSRIIGVLNDFKDWFDKEGKLKDTAYSKINNLTNKNNRAKLERLKKYFPEIEKDLKALATANSVEKATQATAGQYLTAFMSGIGGAGLVGLLSGSLTLGFAVKAILGSALLTPKNFVKVLEYEGQFNKFVRGIADKLKKGGKMTTSEADELGRLIQENPEYYKGVVENLTKKGILQSIDEMKKGLDEQLKNKQITQEQYDKAIKELDYNKGIVEATYGRDNQFGKSEREVSAEERARLEKKYGKKFNDVGFVSDVEGKLKEGERGYTYVKRALYKISENPTNTTYQHELFHAVFSVVDNETKEYILGEARKILKDNKMDAGGVEERLAESFGEYARRQDVKLGILDKPTKGMDKFRQAVKNLFQKVYEWFQGYKGDRDTINKMFNEILDDNIKLDNGKIDLSYILGENKGKLGEDGGKGVPVKPRTPKNGGGIEVKKKQDIGLSKKDASIINKDSTGKELSEGQQKFFKDSKIVDDKGNLLKVYHGTHNDFTVFDRSKIGSKTNNKGLFGEGFYFTSNKDIAERYSSKGWSKDRAEGKVMGGYVNIKNPFMWNSITNDAELNMLKKELGLKQSDLKMSGARTHEMGIILKPEIAIKFREMLEKKGYDGVWYKYKEGGDEIVAFNSNQFKNVDNLNPTKSEDIRYKKDSITPRDLGLQKNTGKTVKNDYSLHGQYEANTKVLEHSNAEKGRQNVSSDLFGLTDDSGDYIIVNGQRINSKINKNNKSGFSGKKVKLQEKNRVYYDNIISALNGLENRKLDSTTEITIGKTQRGRDIYTTEEQLVHAFKGHGAFYIENLVEAANSTKNQYWEIKSNPMYANLGLRPRIELEVPGSDEVFIVGLKPERDSNNRIVRYLLTSFRESKPSKIESKRVKLKNDVKLKNTKGLTTNSKNNIGLAMKVGYKDKKEN